MLGRRHCRGSKMVAHLPSQHTWLPLVVALQNQKPLCGKRTQPFPTFPVLSFPAHKNTKTYNYQWKPYNKWVQATSKWSELVPSDIWIPTEWDSILHLLSALTWNKYWNAKEWNLALIEKHIYVFPYVQIFHALGITSSQMFSLRWLYELKEKCPGSTCDTHWHFERYFELRLMAMKLLITFDFNCLLNKQLFNC